MIAFFYARSEILRLKIETNSHRSTVHLPSFASCTNLLPFVFADPRGLPLDRESKGRGREERQGQSKGDTGRDLPLSWWLPSDKCCLGGGDPFCPFNPFQGRDTHAHMHLLLQEEVWDRIYRRGMEEWMRGDLGLAMYKYSRQLKRWYRTVYSILLYSNL